MSSSYVRTQFKNFLAANAPTETVIDLTASYLEISRLVTGAGITPKDPWLGLQFIGSSEVPVSIHATNTEGQYREEGVIYLHVVHPVRFDAADLILARAEDLRDSIRGQRIGDIIIDSVAPPNFESGATIEFEGGYTSASISVGYYRDLKI